MTQASRRLLGTCMLLAAMYGASPCCAQERFFETATVQARPLSSATGSVTVLERAAIETSGARTVGELLRLVPGVTVTTNSGRGGFSVAQIRAGEPNFTLVLLDGVPLNDSTYQVGDVFNLEGLPTAGIERIEIVRGPLSSFYGSTGLAGVVQIFTREGGPGQPRGEAEISAGDASFRRLSGTLSGSFGTDRGSWSVTGLGEEEAERIAEERFEQAGGLASLSLALNEGTKLRFKARGSSWEGDDYPDASGGPVFGSGELRHSDNQELSLATELSLGKDRHQLAASIYRHGLDRESPAVFPQVPSSIEETRYTRTRFGWASVLKNLPEGGRWSAGVDVQREEGRNDSVLLLPEEFGGAISGDYEITRTLPGAYTELLVERSQWTFEAGSRIDLPEDHAAQWSPRLGIGWRPADRVRLHASAGRAWKLPSFFALASPPALGGNPDLRPETVIGGDLGADWQLAGGRADAGLTVFYNRYKDLIDFDFDLFTHLNRSEVETRGAEGTFGWHPSAKLTLDASATWQKIEDRLTKVNLRHRPEWSGGLRLRWEPITAISLDLEARTVSRYFDQQIPVRDRETVSGYELVNLGAAWRFAAPWELRLHLDNLLDQGYETLIGFPGPERSLRAGLRWRSKTR
ncbi:MAG TPA: TonB-dependent receptor [Thermoanaerobaculia bacterium]|nr:TonB-dependent receptor [Thermoanaerobaculia bacterium]